MGENICLNVIYDNRHPEDYGRLLGEFIQQEITKFVFWTAIVLPDSVVKSINLSHKTIVQFAKDNGYKECCIAEQDLAFSCPTSWEYFLKNKPDKYSLYLWGSYIVPISNNKVCGLQLYFIDSSFYDAFLSAPDNVHIDTYMDELKGDYHYCYPFPALQRPGFSANNKAICDYNKILEPKDIYKG